MFGYKLMRAVGVSLLLFFLLVSCDDQKNGNFPFHFEGQTMGTTFNIKVSDIPENLDNENLKKAIKALLKKINLSMSTYINDSEISLLNQSKSTQWQEVTPEFYKVLKAALSISELSNGAFDITVGPIVNLWGFGIDSKPFSQPDETKIQVLLNQMGYKHFKLAEYSLEIKKLIPNLYMDLSAIAKGYAVDQVSLLLEEQGIANYLVEIGGEIKLKGQNLDKKLWRIAIEKPVITDRAIHKVLNISNAAMATSGDYRNYYEENGVRYSHTIDPRTGYPITHNLASVTVVSDSAMIADGLATAIMVLGSEKGYEMAKLNKIAALLIIKTVEGFSEKHTPEFKNYLN